MEVVRLRVLSNIVAVRTYPSMKDQEAAERRALMEAKMKPRGADVAGRELDQELADMRRRRATLEEWPSMGSIENRLINR